MQMLEGDQAAEGRCRLANRDEVLSDPALSLIQFALARSCPYDHFTAGSRHSCRNATMGSTFIARRAGK